MRSVESQFVRHEAKILVMHFGCSCAPHCESRPLAEWSGPLHADGQQAAAKSHAAAAVRIKVSWMAFSPGRQAQHGESGGTSTSPLAVSDSFAALGTSDSG
jgi:hypothetical protein